MPKHTHQCAKSATYAPPGLWIIGAPFEAPVCKNRPHAMHKTLPHMHGPPSEVKPYKRAIGAPITVTPRELMSLSPKVSAQVQEVSPHHILDNTTSAAQSALLISNTDKSDPPTLPTVSVQKVPYCTPQESPTVVSSYI
ncbi:hypothetical protein BYT27DRAFT_7339578 [Phlegmacium glaucopus]|nr:hypothetical protein BYT27DRAFT_7339578 [Phlegmacium glaucopus]